MCSLQIVIYYDSSSLKVHLIYNKEKQYKNDIILITIK
jgi:hypothetical protein